MINIIKKLREKNIESQEEKVIFAQAKKNLEIACQNTAKKELPPSKRWQEHIRRITEGLNNIKSAKESILFGQKHMGFDHRLPADKCAQLFQLHEESLKAEFPHFSQMIDALSDSPYSIPETLTEYNGRLVSNMFYFHLRYVLQCLTYIEKPEVICEIGGGYGSPARLWLQNTVHRPTAYVIIDFPESLFFAEVFLRVNFKKDNILYIKNSEKIDPAVTAKYSVILCPIKFVDALAGLPFDLVINTGSLHEMTEEWVDFWMEWLQKQNCRYFYSLNYFAQPLSYMAEATNAWSPRLTKEWTVRLQTQNPHFIKQQTPRCVAEILAEKNNKNGIFDEKEILTKYKLSKERYLDGQTFLEAMDIIRIYPDHDIMWDLLQRCVSEMKSIPKEAYYLAEYLHANVGPDFKAKNGSKLNHLRQKLDSLRIAGKEGVPHEWSGS